MLSLYRAARELPKEDFQDFAIQLIKPLLDFESSIWGFGYVASTDGETLVEAVHVHTYAIDPESVPYWENINRADKVIPIVLAHPGRTFRFHAPTLFASPTDAVMRDYAERFGRQSYLITVLQSGHGAMAEWISFYRPDPHHQYTDAEAGLCERLVTHFGEALQINWLMHQAQSSLRDEEGGVFFALTDARGGIFFVQEGFLMLLQEEWAEADASFLPLPLMSDVVSKPSSGFAGRRIHVLAAQAGDQLLLSIRRRTPLDTLSPRQHQVAEMFAVGQSHKEIGKRLNIAPATVRNHLAAIYGALGVSTRTELMSLARGAAAPRG